MPLDPNNMQFKPLVLIVDDEEHMRFFVGSVLKKSGYEVVYSSNGHEAIDQLQNNPVDLVVTDLIMPEMDGMDFYQSIKEARHLCKVIVISGSLTPNIKQHLLDQGVHACLDKPIKIADLNDAVTSALNMN